MIPEGLWLISLCFPAYFPKHTLLFIPRRKYCRISANFHQFFGVCKINNIQIQQIFADTVIQTLICFFVYLLRLVFSHFLLLETLWVVTPITTSYFDLRDNHAPSYYGSQNALRAVHWKCNVAMEYVSYSCGLQLQPVFFCLNLCTFWQFGTIKYVEFSLSNSSSNVPMDVHTTTTRLV